MTAWLGRPWHARDRMVAAVILLLVGAIVALLVAMLADAIVSRQQAHEALTAERDRAAQTSQRLERRIDTLTGQVRDARQVIGRQEQAISDLREQVADLGGSPVAGDDRARITAPSSGTAPARRVTTTPTPRSGPTAHPSAPTVTPPAAAPTQPTPSRQPTQPPPVLCLLGICL